MPIFPIQASFSRGEISPRLWARADISHYPLALKECTNFTVMRQGGVTRRPGTRFINEVKDSSRKTRLIPFIFSTEQAYVLEFGHLYMRVYALGGIVTSGGVPVEIATPYTEAQIFDIHYVQSADVLYVAHEAHAPRKISRTSDTTWTIEPVTFNDGPYLEVNSSDTTLLPSGRGSVIGGGSAATNVSIESGSAANVFDHTTSSLTTPNRSGWVSYTFAAGVTKAADAYFVRSGGLASLAPRTWTFEGFDGTDWVVLDTRESETGWSGGETRYFEFPNKTSFAAYRFNWTDSNAAQGGSNPYSAFTNLSEVGIHQVAEEQTPFNLTASSVDGINDGQGFLPTDVGRAIRLKGDDGRWRWARIEGHVSATVVTIRLYGHSLFRLTPTLNWSLGAWSDETGWPARVTFYQERLTWARSRAQPQTIWMSKSGVFDDYGVSQPLLEDDGVSVTILSENMNEIQWIIEGGDLLIGTSAAVRSLGPGDGASAFSPTNMMQRKQVAYGSSSLQPAEMGQATLFVDRFRRGIREAMYSFESDGVVAPEVTILSEHVFSAGIADMAYQASPMSVLWTPIDTGIMGGITYEREQEMFASHKHRLGGRFGNDPFAHVESVASIPGARGDELWLIAKRTINGVTKRYVEQLADEFDGNLRQAFFVDSGLSYSGAPQNTFSGLDHLEGETVAILGDGTVFPTQVVTGGSISLPEGATVTDAVIGLPYTSQMHTLDPGVSRGDGTGLGRKKKITSVRVDLYETGQLYGRTAGSSKSEIIVQRSTADLMDNPVPLVSGWKVFRPDGSWRESPGEVVLFVDEPLPATIRAIVPVIEPEP